MQLAGIFHLKIYKLKILFSQETFQIKSRSHTIDELKFKQLYRNKNGALMQRLSIINLVDLAGRLVYLSKRSLNLT